jgi:hypothetical protein
MKGSTQMVEQYLKFAECCEQLAKRDDLGKHRWSLLEMAELWRELAKETEDAG